jgi:hypothetical protein
MQPAGGTGMREPGEDMKEEIYLTLLLLGADPMLLRTFASWKGGMDDTAVLEDLRNWNEARRLQVKEWLSTLDGADLQAAQDQISRYEHARGQAM